MNIKTVLSTEEFLVALEKGHLVKIRKVVSNGQPLNAEIPWERSPAWASKISPLAMAWQWPWDKKEEECIKTLEALIQGGADVNHPDEKGRMPLHSLLWLVEDLPKKALELLVNAGAKAHDTSATVPGKSEMDAISICLLMGRVNRLPWILELVPGLPEKCAIPPLLTLAWNDDRMDDSDLMNTAGMLYDAGADLYRKDTLGRTAASVSPRVKKAVENWISQNEARAQEELLDSSTPTVKKKNKSTLRL